MTSHARQPGATIAGSPSSVDLGVLRVALSDDLKWWGGSVLLIILLFAFLQNQYWVPGGDSEVYIASARNVALGNGYMFNGQAAKIAPPGWPLVLAGVMKFVSPTFVAMKLVTLACMVGVLATFYWVLRRFASPKLSAGVIVLTALISHVYALTYWLHSDALFTLVTALMLLVALQINEGRSQPWRIVALLALCFAGAMVRYAGIINILIIAAALMHGDSLFRMPRRVGVIWLSIVVTIGSFFAIRWAVNHFAPPRVPFEDTASMDTAAIIGDTEVVGDTGNSMPSVITGTGGNTGYTTRVIGYGTWFSYLFWQPLRLGAGLHLIWWVATGIGWIVAVFFLRSSWERAKHRTWLMPAVAVYTFALCLNWPHATARYLVPITPLILLMIVQGILSLRQAGKLRPVVTMLGVVGFASVVLCNAMLYAEEVRIMRSSHFADRYEAGLNKSLIAAAHFLREHNVGHWQTAVNPQYKNLNKRRMSPTGLRILTMLTGKATQQMPKQWTAVNTPSDREFRKRFISRNRVRYYLEQPPISPWRVSHYRMGWLQEWLTGEKPAELDSAWQLYLCDGASLPVRVPLPDNVEFPTRVPGL